MRKILAVLLTAALCLGLAPLVLAQGDAQPSPDAPTACPPNTPPDECGVKDGGRWGWYRMFVNAQGMGYIQCGACRTDQGCTAFNTNLGNIARCEAFPAPGNTFSHWTADGQYAGTEKVKFFGKVGLRITGNFKEK